MCLKASQDKQEHVFLKGYDAKWCLVFCSCQAIITCNVISSTILNLLFLAQVLIMRSCFGFTLF